MYLKIYILTYISYYRDHLFSLYKIIVLILYIFNIIHFAIFSFLRIFAMSKRNNIFNLLIELWKKNKVHYGSGTE